MSSYPRYFEIHKDGVSVDPTNTPLCYYTTLPPKPQVHHKKAEEVTKDGLTECIFSSPRLKSEILSIPGFPRPLPHPQGSTYNVELAGEAGLGLFACKDFEMGDLIFCERPLLLKETGIYSESNLNFPDHISAENRRRALLSQMEWITEPSIWRMSIDDQQRFMNLADCHSSDGSGPIIGRLRTNGYQVDNIPPFEVDYTAVGKDISRLNHSCSPNVELVFDIRTFSFHIRANRPIKKGMELTCAYIDPMMPYSERQEHLKQYNILCNCAACQNPTAASDSKRNLLIEAASLLQVYYARWLTNPLVADDWLIVRCLGFATDLEAEGLWHAMELYPQFLQVAFDCLIALGEDRAAATVGRALFKAKVVGIPSGEERIFLYLLDARKYKTLPGWNKRRKSGNRDTDILQRLRDGQIC
ncbi:hypothetical protein BDQ17DRAFT_457268 [Cyathus striatus]|nr:hypothetical protein BDQ17DRAFT_457268 [Cyathus striatus]